MKGLVASLIELDEKDFNKSTALEITAGGKLYNVVVQNEKVGKELLQNGKLKKRVTIIPLNKINAHKMSAQVYFWLLVFKSNELMRVERNCKLLDMSPGTRFASPFLSSGILRKSRVQ